MNPALDRRFLNSPFLAPEAPTWPNSNDNLSIKIGSTNYSASDDPPGSSFGNPSMGIILVVLLVTFFLMGFFSVYVRRFAFSMNGELPGVDQPPGRQERGLDRAAIDRLPIVTYDVSAKRETAKGAEQQHEWQWRPDCVVCLTDFQDKETLRLLPRCEHCFHPECIDMWLFSHSTCPVCRRSLLPPPDRINKGSSNRGLVIPRDEAGPDHELETVTHGAHQHLNIENSPSQNISSSSLNPSSTRSQSTGCSPLVQLDIENPPCQNVSSSPSPPLTRSQSTGSSRRVWLDMAPRPPPLSPLPVASDHLEIHHHAVQPFAP